MTDEMVKEEFEIWLNTGTTDKEVALIDKYEATGNEGNACAFYAGFRTAERLAKIEVLDELKERSRSATYSITVESIIKIMLHELKAGN